MSENWIQFTHCSSKFEVISEIVKSWVLLPLTKWKTQLQITVRELHIGCITWHSLTQQPVTTVRKTRMLYDLHLWNKLHSQTTTVYRRQTKREDCTVHLLQQVKQIRRRRKLLTEKIPAANRHDWPTVYIMSAESAPPTNINCTTTHRGEHRQSDCTRLQSSWLLSHDTDMHFTAINETRSSQQIHFVVKLRKV